MRTFNHVGLSELDDLIRESNMEYTGDYVEGCLLDSFIVGNENFWLACYETCANSQSSYYTIQMARTDSKRDTEKLFRDFYKFQAACENELD